jgi:hypothetical protein
MKIQAINDALDRPAGPLFVLRRERQKRAGLGNRRGGTACSRRWFSVPVFFG